MDMSGTTTCKYCGKVFVRNGGRQIFCDVKCRNAYQNQKRREQRGTNRLSGTSYNAKYIEHYVPKTSKNVMQNLTKDTIKARELGMTYGKYKGLQYLGVIE